MQDFKSLRVAVIICDTLVNTHTHTHMQTDSFWPVLLLAQPAELKSRKLQFVIYNCYFFILDYVSLTTWYNTLSNI